MSQINTSKHERVNPFRLKVEITKRNLTTARGLKKCCFELC